MDLVDGVDPVDGMDLVYLVGLVARFRLTGQRHKKPAKNYTPP